MHMVICEKSSPRKQSKQCNDLRQECTWCLSKWTGEVKQCEQGHGRVGGDEGKDRWKTAGAMPMVVEMV